MSNYDSEGLLDDIPAPVRVHRKHNPRPQGRNGARPQSGNRSGNRNSTPRRHDQVRRHS